MAATINTEIRLDKIIPQKALKALIEKDLLHDKVRTFDTKEGVGASLNISVKAQDDAKYEANVWTIIAQSKEELEARNDATTLGNGRVVWTNGTIKSYYDLAEGTQEPVPAGNMGDVDQDLPF